MKTQSTPGPWATDIDAAIEILEREGNDAIEQSAIYVNHGTAKGSEVCVLRHNPNDGLDLRDPEMIANARLIASAPELLSALQGLCDMLHHHDIREIPEVDAQYETARAALSLAQGEKGGEVK